MYMSNYRLHGITITIMLCPKNVVLARYMSNTNKQTNMALPWHYVLAWYMPKKHDIIVYVLKNNMVLFS